MSEVKEFELDRLPGDGRGGIFWNRKPNSDVMCGLELVDHDGYDDDEDEEWDDFGHQWYMCTVRGTLEQVKMFINEHFYGKGFIDDEPYGDWEDE